MLQHSDLALFTELVHRAQRVGATHSEIAPESVLRAPRESSEVLHRSECGMLLQSLEVAWVAGDISDQPHRVLRAIDESVAIEDFTYLPLTHSEEWQKAINWAIPRIEAASVEDMLQKGQARQVHVGNACRNLRNLGYEVSIGALGPHIDSNTRSKIAESVDSRIVALGGAEVLKGLFGLLAASGKTHDGMWLFGNRTGNDQQLLPELPVGWLIPLALKHIARKPTTKDSNADWEALVDLSTSFASSVDCQRFNQWDGFFIDAPFFFPAIEESLKWKRLFTMPQVPPMVLPMLRKAFSRIAWPEDTDHLRRDITWLFKELERLTAGMADYTVTLISSRQARSEFPLLWRYAHAAPDVVNNSYLEPFDHRRAHQSNHEPILFFEGGDDQVLMLPPALTTAAGCEAVFRTIWDRALPAQASDIVGNVLEQAVADACSQHAAQVEQNICYTAGGERLEIDVATRECKDIVLFEVKAKSLTSKSQSGDVFSFVEDFQESFLRLIEQLARNDLNFKRGVTPLTQEDEDTSTLQVIKVAVSPLSYGPASDHVRSSALIHAIGQARFDVVNGSEKQKNVMNSFNKKVEQIFRIIDCVAPRTKGQIDRHRYMMQVLWFDLGQLLYALHRGSSVVNGVSALKHLTLGTQDFWTEAALGERQGLLRDKWHPPRTT